LKPDIIRPATVNRRDPSLSEEMREKGTPEMEAEKGIDVLIVDDEDRFRVTTTATLKKRGFRVKAVASGLEAIEEIKKGDVDVVILDIRMPYMDGHETLRELKRLKPNLEVIMLTGYGSLGAALADRRQGVFAFLTKPCSIDFLADRIQEAVAKKAGFSEYNRRVRDIMVPLSAFVSKVSADQSIAEAVEVVLEFFENAACCGTGMHETLHRSILVIDQSERVIGVIDFSDLLKGLQQSAAGLAEKDSIISDSIYLEACSYMGGFATTVREKASIKVRELLPAKPSTLDENADLMEAAEKIFSAQSANVLVLNDEKPVGVLREKDLFLEMAKIIKGHQEEQR
jgi:CheY-like chemotaxis protein